MNPIRSVFLLFCFAFTALPQQGTGPELDETGQSAVIDQLASKLSASYVLPDASPAIVQALRAAQNAGAYANARTPREFMDAEYDYDRLRRESPEKYESYVDLQPGVWTRFKIVIEGTKAIGSNLTLDLAASVPA